MSLTPDLSVILYRLDPAQNMRRFYRLAVQQDLFGVWTLTREWGRIGHRGQSKATSFPEEPDAYMAMHRHAEAKQKRGYSTLDGGDGHYFCDACSSNLGNLVAGSDSCRPSSRSKLTV